MCSSDLIVLDQGIAKLQTKDYDTLQESMRPLSLEIQGAIAERMCQREPTASLFLTWVAEGKFRKELLSPNRIRLMASQGSESAKGLLSKVFGSINTEANKERERVVKTMGDTLRGNLRGDPVQGWLVYDRICGQCHIMHQRGIEVGPNITLNGRGSFEQLLVSVFNPSLVIGEAYRSVTARTIDGTIVTGLLVSRDDRKTVIKTQGGKEVTLLAEEIEAYQQDKKSLMPEGIETQLTEKELADLFALLTLEAPPGEPESGNAIISGTPENLHRSR